MIEDLNWKSLEDRRKIAKLTMMYKLVNGLVLVNTEDRLIPPDIISRNNIGIPNTILQNRNKKRILFS
jgi:hypothetical protein